MCISTQNVNILHEYVFKYVCSLWYINIFTRNFCNMSKYIGGGRIDFKYLVVFIALENEDTIWSVNYKFSDYAVCHMWQF